MGKELLFEIGTEEIPSTYMPGMIAALKERAEAALDEARLDYDGLATFGTPRRLVLHVADLAERQKPLEEEKLGPPVRNAFDADGNPTKAALGFARTNRAEVSELKQVETPKGARLMYFRVDAGEETKTVFGAIADESDPGIAVSKIHALGSGQVFLCPACAMDSGPLRARTHRWSCIE